MPDTVFKERIGGSVCVKNGNHISDLRLQAFRIICGDTRDRKRISHPSCLKRIRNLPFSAKRDFKRQFSLSVRRDDLIPVIIGDSSHNNRSWDMNLSDERNASWHLNHRKGNKINDRLSSRLALLRNSLHLPAAVTCRGSSDSSWLETGLLEIA